MYERSLQEFDTKQSLSQANVMLMLWAFIKQIESFLTQMKMLFGCFLKTGLLTLHCVYFTFLYFVKLLKFIGVRFKKKTIRY